jgi:hypothetical protein
MSPNLRRVPYVAEVQLIVRDAPTLIIFTGISRTYFKIYIVVYHLLLQFSHSSIISELTQLVRLNFTTKISLNE